MFVPFEHMDPDARIWIYQADKPLDNRQLDRVDTVLRPFLDEWRAHGTPLRCSYTVLHRQFIVIAVDERDQQATGCSIDDSFGIMKQLEKDIDQTLLDRSKVPFLLGGEIEMVDFREIKNLVHEGVIGVDTQTLDNTVQRKGDLESNWVKAMRNSWVRRYLS